MTAPPARMGVAARTNSAPLMAMQLLLGTQEWFTIAYSGHSPMLLWGGC